ncbi:MAG: FtsX-like permease family protein [Actinomycetota bacterium]
MTAVGHGPAVGGGGAGARLRSGATAVRLLTRLARAEPLLVFGIAVVVAAGTFLLTGADRLLHSVSSDDVRRSVADGLPIERTIVQELGSRIGAGPDDDPFRQIDERGQRFLDDDVPPSVAAILGPRQFVVDSPPYRVGSFPDEDDGPFVLSFRFRAQQGIEDELTLVDGSLPEARDPVTILLGTDCPTDRLAVDGFDFSPDVDCRATDVPVHQTAVTAQTAEDLLLDIGDRVVLRPDAIDPAWAFAFDQLLDERLVLEISGIVELTDAGSEVWYGDTALHRPNVTENADVRIVDATGLLAPDSYRRLLRSALEVRYDYAWRHPVLADEIGADSAEALLADLDTMETLDGEIVTRLPAVLAAHLEQRRLTVALLSVAFAGAALVAAASVWVLAGLTLTRQADTWRLMLERGVGRGTVIVAAAVVAVAAVGVAAAIGVAAGVLVVSNAPAGRGVPVSVGLAVVVAAAVVAATGSAVAAGSGPAGRVVAGRPRLLRVRRVVRDLTLVTLAGGAAFLVGRRERSGGLDDAGDLDLLLSATPILVGGGFVVLALRILPPLTRLLAATAAGRRGAVGFLGFRLLTADGRAARSSMVVLVLAVGLAGLAGSVRTSVASARLDQGWLAVGGDVEVRSQADGAALAPDVVALAPTLADRFALVAEYPATAVVDLGPAGADTAGGERRRLDVVAIDGVAVGEVLAGAPDDPTRAEVLDTITRPPPDTGGTGPAAPVAAVAVGPWPARPAVGDRLLVSLDGTDIEVEVRRLADRFPGIRLDRPTVLVDLDRVGQTRSTPLPPTAVRLAGPRVDDDAVLDQVVAAGPGSRLRSRLALVASSERDPLAVWSLRGLTTLGGYGLALALVAAAAGVGLTGPARRRELGLLTTIGLRRRQAGALTAIEQVTPTVLATLAGTALAAVLTLVLRPAVDLAPFASPDAAIVGPLVPGRLPVELTIDRRTLAVVATVVVVAAALTAMAAARLDRLAERRTIVATGGDP